MERHNKNEQNVQVMYDLYFLSREFIGSFTMTNLMSLHTTTETATIFQNKLLWKSLPKDKTVEEIVALPVV